MALAAEVALRVAAAGEALQCAHRVTAICHENPDADTIGAAIAVSILAERLGAQSEIVAADGIPPSLAFLPRIQRVSRAPRLEPDLAVVCDAATLERVGRIAREHHDWFARAKLLNIDHHVSNTQFGDVNLVDDRAAATCEVIARLLDSLDVALDAELATALLAGIVRDSHGFSASSTTADTLRFAARMVEAGAPLAKIHRSILAELPYSTMLLWGRMLAAIEQHASGRIVYAVLTEEQLRETGTLQHDADGLVEFLARVKGAEVALLFRDLGPGGARVSIRTTEGVDAARIAASFGGGGHARRAGFTADDPLSSLLPRVLRASGQELARGAR